MPGPGTSLVGGPLMTGTVINTVPGYPSDMGVAQLMQMGTITQSGTATVSLTLAVPQNSQIIDILADTTTVWNSGTSDTLSVGTAASGTQYASGVDTKSATGRTRPTFTATQLTNMSNVGTNTAVVATVTPVGTAATTGTTIVTLLYAQNVDSMGGPTPP